MNLSRKWLNEFVTVTASDKDFAEAMTLSGSKVELTHDLGEEISNVVVGRVTAMERHPDSDHMWVCQVDVGDGKSVQIVTGAWNVHVNDLVPVALHNSTLPGGKKIEKGMLRGVESNGMMCGLYELGLDERDFPYATIVPAALLNDYHPLDKDKPSIPADVQPGHKIYGPVVAARITAVRCDGVNAFTVACDAGSGSVSLSTGCRRGELCALQWSDFTFRKDSLLLTISRSRSNVAGKGIVEGSTKNGRSREIYLSGELCGIIRSYRHRKKMEAERAHHKLSPYLFTDEHGQLIHPDTFTKRLRKIYDSIGFPREYHLHTLRHYFVTALLHCGVDKQTVADLVGHGDTGFLERTYCHPQQAQKEQAADTMRTVLRPDGSPIFNLAAACMAKRRGA